MADLSSAEAKSRTLPPAQKLGPLLVSRIAPTSAGRSRSTWTAASTPVKSSEVPAAAVAMVICSTPLWTAM
ncbi:Uncharacterised protein [Mycobacteroides abscessus subsp. abscessus]|nr:Uncharacterised protein [Mycobacteroides abscessus subsp. abscessus]SKU05807.1 Uncharacterised protein [Mycobacteroides abscessus subsp. abscessus]